MQTHEMEFMKQAAQAGIAEVLLGKLATERAQKDEVRQFGKRMINDHSHNRDELKRLAADKGVELPRETDQKHRDRRDQLSGMSGSAFDSLFIKTMLEDHRRVVEAFEDELDRVEDSDLKRFISNTVPLLEDHLRSVRRIANEEFGMNVEQRVLERPEQRP